MQTRAEIPQKRKGDRFEKKRNSVISYSLRFSLTPIGLSQTLILFLDSLQVLLVSFFCQQCIIPDPVADNMSILLLSISIREWNGKFIDDQEKKPMQLARPTRREAQLITSLFYYPKKCANPFLISQTAPSSLLPSFFFQSSIRFFPFDPSAQVKKQIK